MPTKETRFDDFEALTDTGDRVLIRSRRGLIELAPAAPGVLRVRVTARRQMPAYRSLSLAEPQPAPPAYQLEAAAEGAWLRLEGLSAYLQFERVQLSFARPGAGPFADGVTLGQRAGSVTAQVGSGPGEHVYGLGEKTGRLDKRGRRYRMRNTDVLLEFREGIGIATDPLYADFPFFSINSPAGSYGIFVDNPEFTTFDFKQAGLPGGRYEFAAPAAALVFYVLAGPALPDVLRQYTDLTGRMPLPALWTMGYHQCRWGYRTADEFRAVARELRSRGLPADALWFDIDYMDGYRVFTWDKRRFPKPAALLAELKADGLRGVTIVDPGVKVDEGYSVYREGQASGHFIRHPDGREYHGRVWPGESALPDFHQAEVRAWWAGLMQRWLDETGLAGIWNDMNEPATTDMSGPITEVLHDGGRLSHPEARNTYGLQMARATFDAMLAQAPDSRPFILTRAAYSGAQTVTALWGGDNSPHWEHLSGSLPLLMNLGLSGMPFVGVDIGGFAGDTQPELLARWFQAGAFYPFCRNHAETSSNRHEPWAFGPEVEAICRRYLELRYQLLPYTYQLFRQAALTGAPLLRPMAWHYPREAAALALSNQFLFGPDLLVAPVMEPGVTARAVYLPRGNWYRWGVDGSAPARGPGHVLAEAPLADLPLYVRGGAIVPMWPAAAHTGAVRREALRIHLWPGTGALDFYEDDGATQAYRRGEYRLTPFKWRTVRGGQRLSWGASSGGYRDERGEWTFILHELPTAKVMLDGRSLRSQREDQARVVRVADDGRRHTLEIKS